MVVQCFRSSLIYLASRFPQQKHERNHQCRDMYICYSVFSSAAKERSTKQLPERVTCFDSLSMVQYGKRYSNTASSLLDRDSIDSFTSLEQTSEIRNLRSEILGSTDLTSSLYSSILTSEIYMTEAAIINKLKSESLTGGSGVHVFLVLWKAASAVQAFAEKSIADLEMCGSDFAVLEALLHKGALPSTRSVERSC